MDANANTQPAARKPLPLPLPENRNKLMMLRKIKERQNLNDMVEEVHLDLYDNDDYQVLLYATYDEQAVEGSLAADNVLAARMIREHAIDHMPHLSKLGQEKLATIAKALSVVLRRYGQSRQERRITVGGEVVPSNGGD